MKTEDNLSSLTKYYAAIAIGILVIVAMIGILIINPSFGKDTAGRDEVKSKLQSLGYAVIFAEPGCGGNITLIHQEDNFYPLLNPHNKTVYYLYDGFAYYFVQIQGRGCLEMIKF